MSVDADSGDQLTERLRAADAGAPPPAPGVGGAPSAPPALLDPDRELWIGAARRHLTAGKAFVPEAARTSWTPEAIDAFGGALADCAKHYGWKFGGFIGHPAAALFAASLPLVWPIAAPYLMPWIAKLMQGATTAANDGAQRRAPAATAGGPVDVSGLRIATPPGEHRAAPLEPDPVG